MRGFQAGAVTLQYGIRIVWNDGFSFIFTFIPLVTSRQRILVVKPFFLTVLYLLIANLSFTTLSQDNLFSSFATLFKPHL